jgi:Matrixin
MIVAKRKLWATAGVFGAICYVVLSGGAAQAFCRSTTCIDCAAGSSESCKDGKVCDRDNNGCKAEGAPLYWAKSEVHVAYHRDTSPFPNATQSEVWSALRIASQIWSDVECTDVDGKKRPTSLIVIEDEQSDVQIPVLVGPNDDYQKQNLILFRTKGWPYPKAVGETIAVMKPVFSNKGTSAGQFLRARIEINASEFKFSLPDQAAPADQDYKDLVAVVTHEMGHYLGLAHSNAPNSIMTDNYCAQQTTRCNGRPIAEQRRLADDDVAGICAIYPPKAATPDMPQEAGCSCGLRNSSDSSAGAVSCGVALALCFGACRRRIRT